MFLELSKRLGTSRSIYSPDLPGCGESDSAASPLSVSAYADAIGDFLTPCASGRWTVRRRAGAAVAVELAAARPKVVGKLCLVGLGKKEGGPAVALNPPPPPGSRIASRWSSNPCRASTRVCSNPDQVVCRNRWKRSSPPEPTQLRSSGPRVHERRSSGPTAAASARRPRRSCLRHEPAQIARP